MEHGREKPVRLLLILAVLAGITAGLYFAVKSYNVSARIRRYEKAGQMDLPADIREEYNAESDHGFQGDGLWYTVYRMEDGNVSFLREAFDRKNKEMEKKVASGLASIRAEKDWYPDFTHPYVWKMLSEKDGFQRLYILYDPKKSLIYFLLDVI